MVVLDRQINQDIIIRDQIIVRVCSIDGNKADIGIIANPIIPIHRSEFKTETPKKDPNKEAELLSEDFNHLNFFNKEPLIISRQQDESITIANDVKITVIRFNGDEVTLGIDAPVELAIHRREIYEAIRRDHKIVSALKQIAPSGNNDTATPKADAETPPHPQRGPH